MASWRRWALFSMTGAVRWGLPPGLGSSPADASSSMRGDSHSLPAPPLRGHLGHHGDCHIKADQAEWGGTFLRRLKLSCMMIQQDPYEPDRWWFAPLLYAGAAVVIAALVLA